jgi:hypothetical protein
MKRFLIKVLIYIMLLTAGAFSLDFILEKGLRSSRSYVFSTWNDIFSSNISSDVIILGGSRAEAHISPDILDSILHVDSYNLGLSLQFYNIQYVVFKLFEKYNQRPKLVIQIVDFDTFHRPKRTAIEAQFAPYYRHEDLLREELKKMGVPELEMDIPAWRFSGYRTILRGLNKWVPISSGNDLTKHKGYIERISTWDGAALNKVISQDSIPSGKEPEMVELFDSFLNYCKGNDIPVIMVFTPEYIKAIEFTKDKETVLGIYRSFSERYNIPFLDYTNDPICYDTNNFYNSLHLNKTGAELFTSKLAHDIKEQHLIP